MNANRARLLTFVFLICAPAFGSVARIEVLERADAPHGYERVVAKVRFEVDPKLPSNRIVRDLDLAPRDERGLVEFSADMVMLRPRDAKAGNGTVLLEIPNRGGERIVPVFDTGDDLLFEQGFTIVSLGWQFDVPPGPRVLRLYPPVALGVTGLVRSEFVPDIKTARFSLGDRNMVPYPVADPADARIALTVRDLVEGPRRTIPRSEWRFEGGTLVAMDAGFEPGRIYEVVYPAKDSPIAGLGPAAVRDLISHLKYDGGPIKYAIGFGISQSGRFLRHFVYDGFNADEKGRMVFDGLMPHVAGGGRGSFNHRFAQPSRDGHSFMNMFYPVDLLPFADSGLLEAATRADVVPKMFYTNSSYEYYGRAASLIHTTMDGRADAPLGKNTRMYVFAGGQHGPSGFPPKRGNARNLANPNDYRWSLRALLVAMQRWVAEGKEPPASQYPRIDAGTLVPLERVKFPAIPGVAFPTRIHKAYRVDYSVEPPRVGAAFPVLVPQVDDDGNEIAGIRMPEVAVPLATYTGWNLRSPEIGAPEELFSMVGSWIPFARTAEERKGDPRPSIAERYPSRAEYLARVEKAARSLASAGYVLDRDVAGFVARAGEKWDELLR